MIAVKSKEKLINPSYCNALSTVQLFYCARASTIETSQKILDARIDVTRPKYSRFPIARPSRLSHLDRAILIVFSLAIISQHCERRDVDFNSRRARRSRNDDAISELRAFPRGERTLTSSRGFAVVEITSPTSRRR